MGACTTRPSRGSSSALGSSPVFAAGVWSMRGVWADVYLVNDPKRPEVDRINAASRLARDPRVTDRQKWDMAMSGTPPAAGPLPAGRVALDASRDRPILGRMHAIRGAQRRAPSVPLAADGPADSLRGGGRHSAGPRRPASRSPATLIPAWRCGPTYALAVDGSDEDDARDALRRLERDRESPIGSFRDLARILQDSAQFSNPPLEAGTPRLGDVVAAVSHNSDAVRAWAGWRGGGWSDRCPS